MLQNLVIEAVENSFVFNRIIIIGTVAIRITSIIFPKFSFDLLVLIYMPEILMKDLPFHEYEPWFVPNQPWLPILARG